MKFKAVLAAAMLLVPSAALAAPGIVTESAGLRAGPGRDFPLVDRIPGGARVNIHGCLRGVAWCDVSWSDDRGWVSSAYLEYLYRNHYVYLPDYVDEIDVPIVPFVLSSYWSSYYAGRPWYHRRAYWTNYWTSHQREATRLTVDRSAARIGRAATRNALISEGRNGRTGISDRTITERNAQIRGRDFEGRRFQGRDAMIRDRTGREDRFVRGRDQGRFAHENGAFRNNARVHTPAMGAREGARFSKVPQGHAMQRVPQQTIGARSPVNAHAQAPVQAPMQHATPAAAPRMNAAPHVAPAAPRGPVGGGPGREHH